MYLETICIEQGAALRLPFHQLRIDGTLAACGGPDQLPSLYALLAEHALGQYFTRTRCRVVYDHEGFHEISFSPYIPQALHSLRLLEANQLDYARKYADRSALEACYAQRGSCDDVLLVKDGWLTDTTKANIALYDGEHWYTPARPLLQGTHRADLLARGYLREANIAPHDLPRFSRLRLFNAMLHWGEIELPSRNILSF
ncbi:MAG: aminotransferase class IV [Bacteroidales bacterium]|nr:aminotransferase class IV [Bacteroidales bacterium]